MVVYKEDKMIYKGKFGADKIKYKDGVGCCIWQIINKIDPDTGLCWDFSYKDIDTIINLLQELKKIKPIIFKENKK